MWLWFYNTLNKETIKQTWYAAYQVCESLRQVSIDIFINFLKFSSVNFGMFVKIVFEAVCESSGESSRTWSLVRKYVGTLISEGCERPEFSIKRMTHK